MTKYAVAHWVPVSIHGVDVGLGSLFGSFYTSVV